MKKCTECKNEKSLDEFYKRKIKNTEKYYIYAACKSCFKLKYRGIDPNNPKRKKHKKIKVKCELCKKSFETSTNPTLKTRFCSKKCRYEVQSRLYSLRYEIGNPVGETRGGFY